MQSKKHAKLRIAPLLKHQRAPFDEYSILYMPHLALGVLCRASNKMTGWL
jgi:hypothetical protein